MNFSTSTPLGCVDIVGCVTCEELVCWEDVPESVGTYSLVAYLFGIK